MSRERIGRRGFLRVAGLTGLAAAGSLRWAPAETPAAEKGAEPPATAPPVTLPPAPGPEVYRTRIESARALMRDVKASAIIEIPGSSFRYLTGLGVGHSERLLALVLPLEGEPLILCPAFEREIVAGSPAGITAIETWEEDEDAFDALKKLLRRLDLDKGQLAIAGTAWYDEFARIHHELPRLTFVSSSAIIGSLRERKGPEEIACMKAAARITELAIGEALREAREGMREDELSDIISRKIAGMGARGGGLVQFGPRSAVPHNGTSDRKLAAGEVILVDYGARVHGYCSDVSRTAVLGRATGRMKMIHATIRQAQDFALEKARPGVRGSELDQIARATLGARGLFKLFLHRLGHGIGLDGHEPPYLSAGYSIPLQAGNVVTLEPGAYTAGEYGIRVEDMIELTATGAALLTTPPADIIEI